MSRETFGPTYRDRTEQTNILFWVIDFEGILLRKALRELVYQFGSENISILRL